MKKHWLTSGRMFCWIQLLGWFAALSLVAVGCGGGGGDSGSSGSGDTTGIIYSGLTTPATVTEDNAETITSNALDAGSSAPPLTGIAALDDTEGMESDPRPRLLANVAKAMENAIEKLDVTPSPQQNVIAAVQSESGSIDGSCGGSAVYSIQADTNSGDFSGSITFNSYCEDGVTLNGSAAYSGSADPNTDELESVTLSFDTITGTSGSESITMDGEIDIAISGSTLMVSMDMLIRNNNTHRVYKIANFQMDITDRGGYEEIEINGRFYDPQYGYVELETTTAFRLYAGDDFYDSGQMILTGEDGPAGGPTKIRLTALSATTCQVEADTNGDGTYDYDSGPILWTEL